MNIVFPELANPNIQQALALYQQYQSAGYANPLHPATLLAPVSPIPAPDLANACTMLTSSTADAMIAGIDHSSRDVILACREHLGMSPIPSLFSNISNNPAYSTFSGLAVLQRGDQLFLLADMAACKHPTPEQLTEIVAQTITSASKILSSAPRVALLSFSTFGSGGKDDTITLMQNILQHFQPLAEQTTTYKHFQPLAEQPTTHDHFQPLPQSTTTPNLQPQPLFYIDGEMQLDAALNPTIATKKSTEWTTRTPSDNASFSPVAGQANVLIVPDLNTGNILYKAFEQLGGFHAAGPILQGFNYPVSDLSRGSTPWDIFLTICALTLLA